MTPEKLHEAIGLLPSDLVAEADEKRNQLPKRKSHRKQFAAMAACFAVVLACGLFLTQLGMGGSSKSAPAEMAVQEAPAAPEFSVMEPAAPAVGAAEDTQRNPVKENATPEPEEAPADTAYTVTVQSPADFALRLLQITHKESENTLVSPLSAFSALAMTAGGAEGQTLSQMEEVLGMAAADMAPWLEGYLSGTELKLANGIWFTDDPRLTLHPHFPEDTGNRYQAEITQAPMSPETCDAINRWVKEKTDGMIPEILEEIPEDAMMYLVNALAFDARWPEPYYDHQVSDGIFTTGDGCKQTMQLMHSTEHLYLENDLATGFIKPYKDSRYGFAVLLPRENVSVSDCLLGLTGGALQELLRNPADAIVYAAMPKFETEYNTELSDVLKAMGMTDAFDPEAADFSGMGTCKDGKLHISRVRHKTFLSVGEQGTKAGAATMVEIVCGAAFNPEIKHVTLDRPFLYMIVDLEQGFPIFFGAMMDMSA